MKLSTPESRAACKYLFIGRFRLAERDIVTQLSEEQVGVLHRKANAGAQIGGIVLPGIHAVDQNASLLGFVKAEQSNARLSSCQIRLGR